MRVLIADDDPGVVSALQETLGADPRLALIGAADTGDKVVAMAVAGAPDLVLLDIRMPGGGVAAARALVAMTTPPVIVVFSATTSARLVVELLEVGVVGVVEKGRAGADLTDLLLRCWAGEVILATSAAPAAVQLLISRARAT